MATLRRKLAELAKAAANLNSEATLRQYFIQALDEFVKEQKLFPASAGQVFQLEESIIRGRADAKIGGLAFEVKLPKPKGKGLEAAIKQDGGYIDEFKAKGVSIRGVAYDGERLALLDEDKGVVFKGPAIEGATLLASWLTLLAPAARTPQDLVDRFGSSSALSQQTIKVLYDLLNNFESKIPFIEEVFTIWKAVYGCAANINQETVKNLKRVAKDLDIKIGNKRDAESFVFVTETYLSIFLKLLVARVAIEQGLVPQKSVFEILCQPNDQEHIRYTQLVSFIPHLSNVFEEDPFEWFIDAANEDRDAERQVKNVIRCIVETVDNIKLRGMSQDFLRTFYQNFFDNGSRRALGEFYTNDQLVSETLDAVGYDGNADRFVIDFCCGSGSFIVEVLNRIKANNGKRPKTLLLRDIEKHIFGVDIHPLAVAMARVNFLIAVAPLLSANERLTVPIYWADSLVRLSVKEKSGSFLGEPIRISIPGMHTFRLPDPQKFEWEKLFSFLLKHVSRKQGKADFERTWKRFEQEFSPELVLPFEDSLRDFVK
jgi:N-6 DNA Methylase